MKKWLGWAIFALGLYYLIHFFRTHFSQFDFRSVQLQWRFVFASLVLQGVGWVVSAYLWQYGMRRMGQSISWRTGFIVHLLPQWTVYVPGRVITLVERIRIFHRLRQNSGIATILTAGYELSMGLGALTVAALFLPWLGWAPKWIALLPGLAGLLFCLSVKTRIWNRLKERGLRRFARHGSLPPLPLDLPFLFLTVGVQTLVWLLLGGAFFFLLLSLGTPLSHADMPLVGSYAVAKLGGYLAFSLPAGLGAQEAALVAVLRGKISPTFIASAVLGTRLFFSLVEALGVFAAYLLFRWEAKRLARDSRIS